MNKRLIPITIQLIIFNLILLPVVFNILFTKKNVLREDCKIINNNWSVSTDQLYADYDVLPRTIAESSDGNVMLSKQLTNIAPGDAIGFFSFQQIIHVYIDEKEIYCFAPEEKAKSKMPGNKWNIIPLDKQYEGKTLFINIQECYSNRVCIRDMFYGTVNGIILHHLKHLIPRCLLSLIMILFGISFIVYSDIDFFHKFALSKKGLLLFGLFGVFRGFWTLIESNIYSFFITDLLAISHISYLSLKIAATLFLLFVNRLFHDNKDKVFSVLTILSYLDFAISVVLQYTGVLDFAYTIYFTHLLLIAGCIYTMCNSFITLFRLRKDTMTAISVRRNVAHHAQFGATFFLLVGSLMDLFRYYFTHMPDIARYSRLGDIIYVVGVSISLVFDFVYLLGIGKQAAIIKENASLDSITHFRNRATFEQDIANLKILYNSGVIIIDLNNLKYVNDNLGHNMGDKYIVEASKVINDIFSESGKIYRIGGDEFCIITKNMTEKKFEKLQGSLEACTSKMEIYQISEGRAGIATGFASFDKKLDSSLKDTMRRADKTMYRRKTQLKNQITT